MVSEFQKQQILKRKASLKNKISKRFKGKKIENKEGPVIEVNASELNWKPVDIPDTLDDFEGFYGLEEIDNVNVKIVDGSVKFTTKDANNKITRKEAEKKEKSIPSGDFEVDISDTDENEASDLIGKGQETIDGFKEVENENLETQNIDVSSTAKISEKNKIKSCSNNGKNKESITKLIDSKDEDDETNVPLIPQTHQKNSEEVNDSPRLKKSDEDALTVNTFSKLTKVSLPEEEADLPEWSELNLSAPTLTALHELGFLKPTEIQRKSIPISIEGKDVIGKAITGSGKTLAYGIPILERSLNDLEKFKLPTKFQKHPTALIFTPTRELAAQVTSHLRNLFKYSPFSDKTVMSLTGGLSIQKQERLLSYGPKVLVATPGRCLEILEKSTELAEQLAAIDFLVLDEADRMLQDGHFDEMKKILEILQDHRPKELPKFGRRWQSLVFSATFSKDLFGKLSSQKVNTKKHKNDNENDAETKEVLDILSKKLKFQGQPQYIDVNPTEVVANNIVEAMIPCSPMERDLMLYYFLSIFPGTTLVFTNSIDSVKRLAPTLAHLGIPTVSIHSSMVQKQRLRAIERFKRNCEIAKKDNTASVLIASDVAARGLDIDGIQHVVHYHLPRTADTYVHRSGRTARAGNEGVSVALCSPQEASGPLRKLRSVLMSKTKVNDLRTIEVDSDMLDQLKYRLDLAAKIAQAEVASQSVQKEQSWIDKAAEELGVDDIDEFEDDFLKRDRKRKEGKTLNKHNIKIMKAQLKDELQKQIRKSGRRSYIAGGINNIAQLLLNNNSKGNVVGYLQKNALEELKDKKKTRKINV